MKKTTSIMLLILIYSCSHNEKKDLSGLDWMLGQWKSQTGEEIIIERWIKTSDTLFHGETWFIDSGDTVANEELKIIGKENEIIYAAFPSGQPLTEFKLTQLKNDEAIFENPAHDFPQKIIYKKIAPDSLYARIEGMIDGRKQSMDFNWVLTNN